MSRCRGAISICATTAGGDARKGSRAGWPSKTLCSTKPTRPHRQLERVGRRQRWHRPDAPIVFVPWHAKLVRRPTRTSPFNSSKHRTRGVVQAGQGVAAVERWPRIEPDYGINTVGVHASCGTHAWWLNDPGFGERDIEAESGATSRPGVAGHRKYRCAPAGETGDTQTPADRNARWGGIGYRYRLIVCCLSSLLSVVHSLVLYSSLA